MADGAGTKHGSPFGSSNAARDEIKMMPTNAQIGDVTRGVWDMLLGLQVEDGSSGVGSRETDEMFTGQIELFGAWKGVVGVHLSPDLARMVAATMFELDPDEAGEADILDALGELANVTAGNIKALLPAPTDLSLPSITAPPKWQPPSNGRNQTLHFVCEGHALAVSVKKERR